ncbi:MAG: cell division topological specificity factor MinE [Clostridia bacterium]|nr:cell division topological specificity factor MinE [Clostridia bacterium]
MFGFFRKRKGTSKNTAKQRLTAVISRDRANVSAEFLLKMTADIISAAVKYIEPDFDAVSVRIERTGTGACLCAKLPVVAYKQLGG